VQINALKGKKVVSTSRTPGHTKWRQTIFLSPKLVLQDCPGLVFPALDVPKPLQVLCGIYPLSQLREPYSAVHYLAERVPVEEIYRLEKVNPDEPWSGWHICQAYAKKRGYTTRRGNYDGHRAGIEILKDVWDGRVVLYFLPYQTHINLHSYLDSSPPNSTHSPSSHSPSSTALPSNSTHTPPPPPPPPTTTTTTTTTTTKATNILQDQKQQNEQQPQTDNTSGENNENETTPASDNPFTLLENIQEDNTQV
jgi:hypothetical protein